MEDDYGNSYTYLQAYIHQVGGHSSMLCLDDVTVCKPLIDRELRFYEKLPPPLKNFTPKFYGVIKVNVIRQGDYINLVGYTPSFYTPQHTGKHAKLKLRRSGSMDTDISTAGLFEEDETNKSVNGKNSSSSNALHVNPWVVKCHRDHLINLATTIEEKHTPQNFLLLENLTSKFRLPCILDLKMGTRQYDDSDSLAKRQSKMVKVVSTTSGKLGVRIGGMQVYQVTTGRFLCRNKFFGRSLSTNGFSNALRHFLHDGQRFRTELLPSLIRKLEVLAETVAALESLRLYTTSLLLLYEGQPLCQPPPIDRLREKRESFARSVSTSLECDFWDTENCMDRSNSAESLSELLDGVVLGNESRRASKDVFRRRSSSCTAPSRMSPTNIASNSRSNSPSTLLDPLTDVRIIDFAHSTHSGMSDSVSYTGPDQGFLFGLGNMISILKAIDRDFR
ncbi:hypothetical protein O3M35_011651 [Rhynocoris fuscipes]|uniref:Kinase n=1 Tax=Rhynocoris fuscipes TaxID=488301 RepID=A0AAW1CX09_9HEMI